MNINTTQSVRYASAALGPACERTAAQLEQLMKQAGIEGAPLVQTVLPFGAGAGDDVVFCGLNGARFYFRRGETVTVPEPVLAVLRDCRVLR